MVKFVAWGRVEMEYLLELGHIADTGPADVSRKTSTSFKVTQGHVDFYATGKNIGYIFGVPWSGTIKSLLVEVDKKPAYKFSDFSIGVQKVWDLMSEPPLKAVAELLKGNDDITGSRFNDEVSGFAGNDTVRGGKGNDAVWGGQGKDKLFGDDGTDSLRGGAAADTLDGGAGRDTADFSDMTKAVQLTLGGSSFRTAVIGGEAADKVKNVENVTGGKKNDTLTGDGKDNTLKGGDGNDALSGMGGEDILVGGDGNDDLSGGADADKLTGGDGADDFIFDAAPGPDNIDKVTDFEVGVDRIVLKASIFGFAPGDLPDAAFAFGEVAGDADQRILYDDATGRLYFDADGSDPTIAPVQFAKLAPGLGLSAGDFFVVA